MSQQPAPSLTELTSGGITALVRPGDAANAIVFLHGIGSRAASFAPLFERWQQGLMLLAWNAPGYAGSQPLPEDWPSALDYAERLNSLLEQQNLVSIDLVGHSLGCLIAGAFARRYPAKVRKLALLSPLQLW